MSRGLGQEQRWLLEHVNDEPNGRIHDRAEHGLPQWTRLADAAIQRYGSAPTASQIQSLRRAALTLLKRGLIELETGGIDVPWEERPSPVRRATVVRRITTAAEWRAALDYGTAALQTAPDEQPGDTWVPTKTYWTVWLPGVRKKLSEHELSEHNEAT